MISNTQKDGSGSALWMTVDSQGRLILSGARNRTIISTTLTAANTEYPVTLNTGVRRVIIQGRHASGLVKMKFSAGGSEFWLFNGQAQDIEGYFDYPTFVFESPAAGTIVDLIELKD